MAKENPAQILLFADVLPNGNGGFVVTPRKPVDEISPKHAAKFLGISKSGVYRLLDAGVLQCSRPSPGKILIPVEVLKKHKEAVKDSEFWPKLTL